MVDTAREESGVSPPSAEPTSGHDHHKRALVTSSILADVRDTETPVRATPGTPRSGVALHHSPGAENRPPHQPGHDDTDRHRGGLRYQPGIPPTAARAAAPSAEHGEPARCEVGRGHADDGALQVQQVRDAGPRKYRRQDDLEHDHEDDR